jgi:kumamolisin
MNRYILRSSLGLALLGLTAGPACAAPSAGFMRLRDNVPQLVKQAERVGRHDPSHVLDVTIALKLHNSDQLDTYLKNLQDPESPQYHHFLTPAQFTALYGPTPAEVDALTKYLRQQGVHVTGVSSNRLLVHVKERSSVLEKAFNVTINDFSYDGRKFYGTQQEPQFGTAVAGYIQSVGGLSNVAKFRPLYAKQKSLHFNPPTHGPAGRINSSPAATPAAVSNTAPAGFSPQQIATAYNWPSITSTANGAGVTIAIGTADSSNLSANDYAGFWNQYSLPGHSVSVVPVNGNRGATDGTIETALDVERAGAMAPGANIVVYDAASASDTDFTAVYNAVATANTAQVFTTSWGAPESQTSVATMTTDSNIFKQMAAQGISAFAAAGDSGSADGASGNNNADYPSSDPYITAAGGTHLVLTSSNTIYSETAWVNSGGAQSVQFTEPSWQTGTGVPQNGYRNNSDLSMVADPSTGYSVLYGGSWAVYGGTSFVAPQLAGLFAVKVSQAGGTRQGLANALIYAAANSSNYANDFHDITSGSNGAFSAGAGWDHPTGWGTPNATSLLADLGSSNNTAPVASNGAVSTTLNMLVSGTLAASDADHDALTFSIVKQPGHGTVNLVSLTTGAFTYTPATNYSGPDSFLFTATDSAGKVSNTATESVTVASGTTNTAPVAKNGSVSTNAGTAVNGVLSASDPDGDTLTFLVTANPAHGTVSITNASTGAFTYTPASGYSGSDSFTFEAKDSAGNASNTATESVTVTAVPVAGGTCPTGYTHYAANISQFYDVFEPNGTYYAAGSGFELGQLSGPSGTDFDLYLYKWSSTGWRIVASSTGSTSSESISYNGTSGYYVWAIYAYKGSGTFNFCLKHP